MELRCPECKGLLLLQDVQVPSAQQGKNAPGEVAVDMVYVCSHCGKRLVTADPQKFLHLASVEELGTLKKITGDA